MTMTHEEYINATREVTNFLTHIFSEKVECLSTILLAQADHDTERLIDLLGLVKGRCEDWIEELKAIER